MKKIKQSLCRISSLLLLLIMVVSMFTAFPLTASAATVNKTEKSYDIAVVYDNSGSMYMNKSQSWCRAKYAMEIFASMLNYDKDKLHIFPMWEVTTDGSQPESGGSYEAIEIKSKQDIDKISNLYTVRPSNTPFAPITEAYDYLKASIADEKWLIILTDGDFNEEARGQRASIDLQSRVSSLASGEIKIQYLGFGKAKELVTNEANNFFAKKSSDTSLKDDLIGICNSIFQRSVLPSNRLSGNSLKLDLSMKNVIVFAQGANASITSLTDSDGKEIAITLDSGQRKYSDIKAKGYSDAAIDTSLAGQVVTFSSCPKGEYTLTYSGADAVQVFYEPDVDIEITLTNSDGEIVDNADDFVAGEYTVTSKIVDSTTREDVTSHELMGNDVRMNTYVKTSKDSEYKEYANGSKIVFEPDDKTEIFIQGEYLGKYKISSKDDPKLAWLTGISVKNPTADFKIDAKVLQSQSWFKTTDYENWKPIRVTMTLDGQPLTDEQLNNTKLSITASGNLEYRCEPVLGESAYDVYIAQDENGNYIKPETGKYKLGASASYIDEYGNESTSASDVSFEIQRYSKFLRWLFWLIVVAVIITIIMMILNHPTLPSSVYLNIKRTCHTVKTNGTSIGLSTDLYPGEIRCEAKACTPLKDKGKTTAGFEVKSIKPIGSVNWYEIDGSRFKKVNGKYVNEDNETIEQVKPKVRVSDDTELKWNTNRHTVTGRIYINHND